MPRNSTSAPKIEDYEDFVYIVAYGPVGLGPARGRGELLLRRALLRLNDVMKQLTIIATVFLPLSFLTGFFGQNFAWLADRIGSVEAFFGIGVGT
jgi:CorA-like Mg2+ transporter protein